MQCKDIYLFLQRIDKIRSDWLLSYTEYTELFHHNFNDWLRCRPVQWAMRCLSPPLPPLHWDTWDTCQPPAPPLTWSPGKCSGKLGLESCDLWMFPRNGVKWGVELTQPGAGAAKGAWLNMAGTGSQLPPFQLSHPLSVAVTASLPSVSMGVESTQLLPPPPCLGHTQRCMDYSPDLHCSISYASVSGNRYQHFDNSQSF